MLSLLRGASLMGALAAAVSGSPVLAESKLLNSYPADRYAISPGGVDLRTGRYIYSETDLSVGPADDNGTLKLTRTTPIYDGSHANPFGNLSHNWDIMLMESRISINNGGPGEDYRMEVHLNGRSLTFDACQNCIGYAYKAGGATASLAFAGGTKESSAAVFTATLPDGSILVFRPIGNKDCSPANRCAYVSEITAPDGTKHTFSYAYNSSLPGDRARLKQVVSSRGYALLLEGSGSLVTKACVLNLTIATLPSDGFCPPNALAQTTYSYVSNKLASVTAADGSISQFSYSSSGYDHFMSFFRPGSTMPWLTNAFRYRGSHFGGLQEIVHQQSFSDGRTFSYGHQMTPYTDYDPIPEIVGGSVNGPVGNAVQYLMDFLIVPGSGTCTNLPCAPVSYQDFENFPRQQTPGPVLVSDELGRETTADYCDPNTSGITGPYKCVVLRDIQSLFEPSGIRTDFVYDGIGNVIKSTQYPKSGSTLAPIVMEAAYATSNPKAQTKPLWVKDERGNVTDYTYDINHGGVLTETGPQVSYEGTMVRPQKRFTYAQRYAWISNGSGGYVQGSTPSWLLTSESFCQRSAATGNPSAPCATTGDEVVTTYDYGPNSGPNNLLLRGKVVSANGVSLRTCYGYDAMGNRIFETTPRAGLISCP